jgi:hypothetical protein
MFTSKFFSANAASKDQLTNARVGDAEDFGCLLCGVVPFHPLKKDYIQQNSYARRRIVLK